MSKFASVKNHGAGVQVGGLAWKKVEDDTAGTSCKSTGCCSGSSRSVRDLAIMKE